MLKFVRTDSKSEFDLLIQNNIFFEIVIDKRINKMISV